MDPKIAALQNASTSLELKAAIDDIPRDEKYYTPEIRDLLRQKQNLIIDSSTADAVVVFLRYFRSDLLRTPEIRDLIIDVLAPKISEGDPIENLGRTISNIVYYHKSAAKLYSNRKSFSAILDCFHRATTAGSAEEIASSINDICNSNPGANKILIDLPVVEAYSSVIPYATTVDSIEWISTSLSQIFKDNEPARQLFGTLEFLEKFRSMKKDSKSHWATSSFTSTMGTLQSAVNHSARVHALRQTSTSNEFEAAIGALPRTQVFFTADILDVIFEKKNLIIDSSTADAVVLFLSDFSYYYDPRGLLCSPEIRDLIIDVLAPKISEGVPVENLGRMISNTVRTESAAELYSNRKSFSVILDCFPRAVAAGNAEWIATTITRICNENPGANKILNDLPVVDAFSAIIPHATGYYSVQWICKFFEEIFKNNQPVQKLFATPAFLETFRTMENFAASYDANFSFKNVVHVLVSILEYATLRQSLRDASSSFEFTDAIDALPRKEKYYTEEVRDLILEKQTLIVDAPTADAVISFLSDFSFVETTLDNYDDDDDESHLNLLLTVEIRDLIIDVLAPKISDGDPVENLGQTISNIIQNISAAELYSDRKSLSAIVGCFHRATTAESAHWIARSINDIYNANPEVENILTHLPFVEAYSAVIPYIMTDDYHATSDDSVRWISNTLVKIWNNHAPAQKKLNASTFFETFRSLINYVNSCNTTFPCDEIVDILRPIVDSRVLTDAAVPSTSSTTENYALNSQLREQIEVLQQERGSWKTERIELEKQLQQERATFDNQLELERAGFELERAEHQRTRNLLELLLKEKESGKRRQREDE